MSFQCSASWKTAPRAQFLCGTNSGISHCPELPLLETFYSLSSPCFSILLSLHKQSLNGSIPPTPTSSSLRSFEEPRNENNSQRRCFTHRTPPVPVLVTLKPTLHTPLPALPRGKNHPENTKLGQGSGIADSPALQGTSRVLRLP